MSTLAIDSIFLVGGLLRLRRATEWVNSEDPALERDADQTTVRGAAAVPDRVLLIGKRAVVLTRLQEALRESGIEADLTQDTAGRVAASLASTTRSPSAARSVSMIAPG